MIDPNSIPGAVYDAKTGRWTITLSVLNKDDGTPLMHNGKPLTEVVMRRGKVNDLLNVNRVPGLPQADMEVQLFALLTGLPAQLLGEIDEVDYRAIQEIYSDFLTLRKRTFAKPASTSPASQDQASPQS